MALAYTGHDDIALGRDGEWISPARNWKIDNVKNVLCVWTGDGYKPRGEAFPSWVYNYLDDDGAVDRTHFQKRGVSENFSCSR